MSAPPITDILPALGQAGGRPSPGGDPRLGKPEPARDPQPKWSGWAGEDGVPHGGVAEASVGGSQSLVQTWTLSSEDQGGFTHGKESHSWRRKWRRQTHGGRKQKNKIKSQILVSSGTQSGSPG